MINLRNILVSLFLSALTGNSFAADPAPPYPSLVVKDVKHVLTAPTRWEQQEWRNAGWAALAIVGTGILVDRPLRDAMRRQPENNVFMRDVERFGASYSLGVLGGFYLAGLAGNNDKAVAVAQDGLAASLIASGIVTPALKYAAGRSRPRETQDIANFRPFSGKSSFPSGHTTQAFAVASVVATHYDKTWVHCASYGIAGLVGLARSYHDAHFASDVVAGAMIGTYVGKSVVDYNQQHRSGKTVLLPEVTPGKVGVRLVKAF